MRRLALLLCLVLTTLAAHAETWVTRQKVSASFAEAKENIVLAIENRGLVVNYISHIADMLNRTGADLGAARQVYAQAEIVEFCSAKLSRQMMELDPHNIVLCPFAIAIYTLPAEPGITWIAYRQPHGAAAPLVEPLLREIASEAAP